MSVVEEIRNDPEKGVKRLECEYKAGLLAVARRFCPDLTDAEALVYRTFSEVVAKIDGYSEQSAFFGWMCKILVNCHAKDVRRKSNSTVFLPVTSLWFLLFAFAAGSFEFGSLGGFL